MFRSLTVSTRFFSRLLALLACSTLTAAATAAESGKDYVQVSVKVPADATGRPVASAYTNEAIAAAFSDVNAILNRHDLPWRLSLVGVEVVNFVAPFNRMGPSLLAAFERQARDIDPSRYKWRSDAINIYLVTTLDGTGGASSFPGDASHRDVIAVARDTAGDDTSGLAAGLLHEIGHYLSLKHTFDCSGEGCESDPGVCRGEGAAHRGWSAKCPNVCPDERNIMSYDDTEVWGATSVFFTDCQIEHMNYELYDPRGDRRHVLKTCRQSCAEQTLLCRSPCTIDYAKCILNSPVGMDWGAECAAARAECNAPCDAAELACNGDCPDPFPAPINLARLPGVVAVQGADHEGGFVGSLAIDGDLNTFTAAVPKGETPAYLEINLRAEFDIETIVLHNRLACCPSRLRDIWIVILDSQAAVQYTSDLANEENWQGRGQGTVNGPERLVFHLPSINAAGGGKVRGQYIQVFRMPDPDLSGSGGEGNGDDVGVLSLAEVGVYGSAPPPAADVNLARYIPGFASARQSSTEFGGAAHLAIDGNNSGDYSRGSVTHTAVADTAPWWELDLGQSYPIGKIVLWNRTDCCAERLHNFRVSLLDARRRLVQTSVHFSDGSYPGASGGVSYGVPAFGNEGKIVRIEHLGDLNGAGSILSLAEVEVFMGPPGVRFVRGDANSSGTIDLSDGIATLGYLFIGTDAPACMDAADANDDGSLDVADPVGTFSWLFSGGRAPMPPSPTSARYGAADCGVDVSDDSDLDCDAPSEVCD